VFDGLHVGHRAITTQCDYILSLSPHPDIVLKKCDDLKLLSTPREFQRLLPNSAILHFSTEVSQLSAEDFLNLIILESFNPKKIVAGYDYRFGAKGRGDIAFLKDWGHHHGIDVVEVSPQGLNGNFVKSSTIRGHLLNGHFEQAISLLGHPYLMSGEVVHGAGKGKELGFPTANLEFEEFKLIPRSGVYYGVGDMNGERHPLLLNIGTAPTLGGGDTKIEAHLLDFKGDLYGQILHVYLDGFLRAETQFESISELVTQIRADEAQFREILRA
jgi:riboflavin kinase/FMN adenylyltransferase